MSRCGRADGRGRRCASCPSPDNSTTCRAFRLRREHAHRVDPAAGIARGVELLAFDWRMRDHLQHLLVAPDVVLERRDVEIADQNRALRSFRPEALMAAHLVEK